MFLGEPVSATTGSPSGPASSVWQCPAGYRQKNRPLLHSWEAQNQCLPTSGSIPQRFSLCTATHTQTWRGSWRCNTCVCMHAHTHTVLSVHPSLDQSVTCMIIERTVYCALPQGVLPDWNVLYQTQAYASFKSQLK